MTDTPKAPNDLPGTIIHLGTFTAKGPGEFIGGVAKLWKDPERDLIDAAQGFLKAADRCLTGNRVVPGVEMLTVPGAVCAAFACELYLKYIHLKEDGIAPRGHDLSDLYASLSESVRASIVERRSDIEEVLDRNRDHFMDARYHYEVEQFSFRQQELLQLAESLAGWVGDRYKTIPPSV